MESVEIRGEQRTIQKVFCNDFSLEIPSYQRPYAWGSEQVEALFDDLVDAMGETDEPVATLSPYFMGSVVLVKNDEDPKRDPRRASHGVIDGQQRLTTLTMLLAVLRACTEPPFRESLTGYIEQAADPVAGTLQGYRLTLRDQDAEFFTSFIQTPGGLDKLRNDPATLTGKALSDSQKRVRDNALLLMERTGKLSPLQRQRLAQYLVTRCYLIIVSTPGIDSAYRIFSVLNDRGLDLSHADILKAEIIGKIGDEAKREEYAKKWEEAELCLGRESFKNLFGHLRFIRRRQKLQTTTLKEFRDHVLTKTYDPVRFMDEVLLPGVEAHSVIRHANWAASEDSSLNSKINEMLRWLKRLGHWEWVPALIHYLNKRPDGASLHRFLCKLERLGAYLLVEGVHINHRIKRYGGVLGAIDSATVFDEGSKLQLTKGERSRFIETLGGEIYLKPRACKYVLARLDRFLSSSFTLSDQPLTVEHVLPQSPRKESQWLRDFPTEEDRALTHRLGNLVLLTGPQNSQASNLDFKQKRDTYFTAKHGVANFALTTQVLHEKEWTPSIVFARQAKLLQVLKTRWELSP